MTKSNDFQVDGEHYKKLAVQPWDAITAWGLGYLDGSVVKYMARWRTKGGLSDLLKAQHQLSKLIEVVQEQQAYAQKAEAQKRAATVDPEAAALRFATTAASGTPLPDPINMISEEENDAEIETLTKEIAAKMGPPKKNVRAKK